MLAFHLASSSLGATIEFSWNQIKTRLEKCKCHARHTLVLVVPHKVRSTRGFRSVKSSWPGFRCIYNTIEAIRWFKKTVGSRNMSVCSCPSTLGCSLHSPAKFLSSPQFSLKTPAPCPITGLPMHYTDLNGPFLETEGGKEVALVILPSACSKSVVATFEPMARVGGMRLIAMDRPGV